MKIHLRITTHSVIPQHPRQASTNRPKVSLFALPAHGVDAQWTAYVAQQRAADLERRERDLEARERALSERADHIRKHGRNNFPPFLPLIYHSIPDEIPEPSRPLITRLFQLWLVLAATLIINLVACIVLVVSGQGDGVRDLSGAITYVEVAARSKSAGLTSRFRYFPIIGLLSFLLWYRYARYIILHAMAHSLPRPIYNAYMKVCRLFMTRQAALTLSPGASSVLLLARSLLHPDLLLTFCRHLLLLLRLALVVFHLHDYRHPWHGECGSYQHDHRFPAWCNCRCGAWYDCDRWVDSARGGQCMVLSGGECRPACLRT
jgi:hypothetical protein